MKIGINLIDSLSAPLIHLAKKIGVLQVVYGEAEEHQTPYMTRVKLGRLRFHIFHRGDADPDLHDHPWPFWTFPLTPYLEEVFIEGRRSSFRGVQMVKRFRLHYRPAEYAHRVISKTALHPNGYPVMIDGPIFTIVWLGAKTRAWGFWKKDAVGRTCWVPWREYIYSGGKTSPCLD